MLVTTLFVLPDAARYLVSTAERSVLFLPAACSCLRQYPVHLIHLRVYASHRTPSVFPRSNEQKRTVLPDYGRCSFSSL